MPARNNGYGALPAFIGTLLAALAPRTSRRIATAQLLEEAARATEGKPWSGELLGALQDRLRAEERALAELKEAKRWRIRRPPHERHA